MTDGYYSDLLELRSIICLVDPRKLSDRRYLDHKIFCDQLNIADVIAANKTDLCSDSDKVAFEQFTAELRPAKQKNGWMSQGQLPLEWLQFPHGKQRIAPRVPPQKPNFLQLPAPMPQPISLRPGETFARRENSGDGYYSCGWLFAEDIQFDYQKAVKLLANLNVTRLKGLLKTSQGNYIFNDDDGALNINRVVGNIDTIIEMIHDECIDWQAVEQQLLNAQTIS